MRTMADKKNRTILWEVGCEGHADAWVVADNWEQATVEAAAFWQVPWREVAAYCVEKQRIVGAPRNVCCRCKQIYYSALPLCESCRKVLETEEMIQRRRLRKAYRTGKVD